MQHNVVSCTPTEHMKMRRKTSASEPATKHQRRANRKKNIYSIIYLTGLITSFMIQLERHSENLDLRARLYGIHMCGSFADMMTFTYNGSEIIF